MSQSHSNNDTAMWLSSNSSASTFSPTGISQFFQSPPNYPPVTSGGLQEMNAFPLNDPAAWDISNMMATDIPEASGAGEMFAYGGDRIDSSDRGYSSESSSQWPSVGSSNSSDRMTNNSARNTRIDAYETVPHNVRKDL